jgi:hypothetical protein
MISKGANKIVLGGQISYVLQKVYRTRKTIAHENHLVAEKHVRSDCFLDAALHFLILMFIYVFFFFFSFDIFYTYEK